VNTHYYITRAVVAAVIKNGNNLVYLIATFGYQSQ
jgi:hypothetical protein